MELRPITVNEAVDYTGEQLASIPDEHIKRISGGIKYFAFGYGFDLTPARGKALSYLRQRLDALKSTQVSITIEAQDYVACDCGHSVPRSQVMTTSRGTSCPDCYDKMSD